MNAGRLDRRIELLSAAETQNSVGQTVKGFISVASVYGQRLELRTSDSARAGMRDTFAMGRFLIRYRDGVSAGMRVSTGGKLYDVVAVDEPDRLTTLVLMVEEVRQ